MASVIEISPMLKPALALAAKGLPVFPCRGKRPYTDHGVLDASTDPDQIRQWWTRFPTAWIGLRTGTICDLVVVDLDNKPEQGIDGQEDMCELEMRNGKLPDTVEALTPSGGRHLYFKANGIPFKTQSKQIAPGIDVRGENGYVIVAPSEGYEWEGSNPQHPADPPQWLVDLMPKIDPKEVKTGDDRPVGDALDIGKTVTAILEGSPLHDSVRDLAAHMRANGASEYTAIEMLRALMLHSNAMTARREEWSERFHDIPRLVASAEKYTQAMPEIDIDALFQPLDLTDLETSSDPAPEYIFDLYMPRGYVTLFGGHGGSGKSNLMLSLSAHGAAGVQLAPILAPKRVRVLFVSMEDPAKLVRYRLKNICRHHGLNVKAVAENLHVVDASDAFGLAYEETAGGVKRLKFTAIAEQIQEIAGNYDLIVIDNASDAYDANENERRLVRSFVKFLGKIAKNNDLAVALLAHIDKLAARMGANGNSYSGSTAWHNSARSRIALIDGELVHEKNNLGPLADPLPLAWTEEGVLVPDPGGIQRKACEAEELAELSDAVFSVLREIASFRDVTAAQTGPMTTKKVLETHSDFPKISSQQLSQVLAELERLGRISLVTKKDGSTNHAPRKFWIVGSTND